MAILAMKRVFIYALKKNRKAILELLQILGIVEVEDFPLNEALEKVDTSKSRALFENSSNQLEKAISILKKHIKEKPSVFKALKGRKYISLKDYNKFAKDCEEVIKLANRIIFLQKEIDEKRAEYIKLGNQLEALAPWMDLDIPMNFKGSRLTRAFIGSLEGKKNSSDILAEFEKKLPEIKSLHLEVISNSAEQTCIFLLSRDKDEKKIEPFLRQMGFAYPSSPSKLPPRECRILLEKQMLSIKMQIEAAEKEIKTYKGECSAFEFMIDYYQSRAEKYSIIHRLAHTKHTFILRAYLPERDCEYLEKKLKAEFEVEVTFETPGKDEDVPVLLHNNAFAESLESVTESYSLPGKEEVDPTGIMSIFYYFLFGLMLSDAMYGFLMASGCMFILKKFKNLENSFKKSLQMFCYCGISTMFWGIMFGSYFGDAIDVIAATFFHKNIEVPSIWFFPVKEPMRLLSFSFAIGIIHVFTGLGIKFYQLVRAKKYLDAVYDVVFWYLLVGGGVAYMLSVEMFKNMLKINFILPDYIGKIATICALVGAVGIVLTAGRESRSLFKRVLKGFYGLYNVSGYLSDILSYSRLLALGLTTGVIASVFNKMGSMAGSGPVGIILFTFVFIIGHSLNMGINLLGAYVHTNRLQFVEFFGKFYEGGSRKFSPFCPKVKYYKIGV
jgi:V/A-type H+-transporting ATPase subunit I